MKSGTSETEKEKRGGVKRSNAKVRDLAEQTRRADVAFAMLANNLEKEKKR